MWSPPSSVKIKIIYNLIITHTYPQADYSQPLLQVTELVWAEIVGAEIVGSEIVGAEIVELPLTRLIYILAIILIKL